MRVALLGFGLIGGSIARALRSRSTDWTIAAWTPSGDGPRAAADHGTIDVAAADRGAAIEGADLVVLAAPPLECLTLLDDLGGDLRAALAPGGVVTDVASTKRRIVERARDRGVPFVGGHPMAGRENAGYAAADEGLFADRPWVVCDDRASAVQVELVERLARDVGARPVRMGAATHDAAVASISHLPLVLSVALVEAICGAAGGSGGDASARATAAALAASGWRDMTRLARGDAAMAAGIAATNADFLADRMRAVRDAVDAWLAELERPGGPDPSRLEARFAAAREMATAAEPGGDPER